MPTPRYQWQAALELAHEETDLTALHARVIEVEDALLERAMEIAQSPAPEASRHEIEAMKSAAAELLKIKTGKLGWPDVKRSAE